ncbi:MAG: hypothetical protein A4S09_05875 [Proteobacteria bacterium SG_bin7]|nr:MAG: hypothetical protein A4S09_05875 [Proteobacteria bacterium SG_bin7]
MKFKLLTPFILLGFALACGHKPQSGKINIQIPWPDGPGYKLQFVPVGFTDLRDLTGPDVEFFEKPSITGDEVSQQYRLVGASPVGKFSAISEGNYVPATYESLLLATMYAHIERLNAHLKGLGYGSLISLPRKVGVNPRFRFTEGRNTNNAVYIPDLDGIFVYPYEKSGLPLAFNGGVLAHEYFHAIFHHIFYKHLKPKKNTESLFVAPSNHFNIYASANRPSVCNFTPSFRDSCGKAEDFSNEEVSSVVLGSMNEGLADTWAWIYTDDTDFLIKSFNEERNSLRKLDGDFCNLPTQQGVRDIWAKITRFNDVKCNREKAGEIMGAYRYSYGTNLSRFLISFTKSGKIQRQELAVLILETLKKMIATHRNETKFTLSFDTFINLFLETVRELKKEITPEQCSIYTKIIPEGGAKVCTK